jgi:hypothetical protein
MQATADATLEIGEVLYQSAMTPDPGSARDVLAFVLCPIEAFAPAGDADELAAVEELIQPAKTEALLRWYAAHTGSARN